VSLANTMTAAAAAARQSANGWSATGVCVCVRACERPSNYYCRPFGVIASHSGLNGGRCDVTQSGLRLGLVGLRLSVYYCRRDCRHVSGTEPSVSLSTSARTPLTTSLCCCCCCCFCCLGMIHTHRPCLRPVFTDAQSTVPVNTAR